MLATYFKEYPSHLAAAARIQAEAKDLLPNVDMDPEGSKGSPDPEDGAASESGRTYTISEDSEGQTKNINETEDKSELQLSPRSPDRSHLTNRVRDIPPHPSCLVKDNKRAHLSMGSLDRKLPVRGPHDGPFSLGSTPTYKQKPNIKSKCGSLPMNFKQKSACRVSAEFKERSLSLEFHKSSKSETKKLRSTSFDHKRISSRSSSEIANTYLPDSLKNFINIINTEEEEFNESSTSNDSEDTRSSSSEEVTSTPTFNMASTAGQNVPISSPVVHEPHCRLSAQQRRSSSGVASRPANKRNSLPSSYSATHLPPFPHPNTHSESGTCPIHGNKPHSHNHGNPSHNHGGSALNLETTNPRGSVCPTHSTPTSSRKIITASHISTSTQGSRLNLAENQLLHCGICSKRFRKPKVLPCLHTFCEHCLVSVTPPESLTLTCPLCRQQSILPKDGVTGLQANRWLSGMIESMGANSSWGPCSNCGKKSSMSCIQCDVILCTKCAHNHEQDSGSDCHSVVSLEEGPSTISSADPFTSTADNTTLFCPSHAGQTLRFFCRNCETAVCSSCTDIEHRDHTTVRLNDAVDDQKDDLHRLIDKVTFQLPCMKEAICDLTDISNQLEVNKQEAEQEVRSCFRALHDLLSERETELINLLNSHVTRKKGVIETQHEELQRWVSGVGSCCEYVERSLSDLPPPMEVVLMKKQMGEQLINYVEVEFPPILSENPHIQFVVGNIDPLKNAFKHVGKIQSNSAVPQQTTAIGDSLQKTVVGKESVVTVVTRDHKGARIKNGGAEVKATITKAITMKNGHHTTNGEAKASPDNTWCSSSSTGIQVLDLNNGSYEMVFTVHSIGTYTLSVFLHGCHISASPFTLDAHMPDADDLSEGHSASNGHAPLVRRQSSRNSQGTRKTSGGSNQRPPPQKSSCSRRTLKEPLEDDLLFKVGRRGRNRGEFVNPQGVCYSPVKDGRIVIADSNNQCVQVFNLAGECKVKFGVRGRNVGQLQRPTGVAALPSGNYAVADYENRWVSVFEPSGKYVSRIGHGKLLGPKGMCVNKQGHLIVVDNKASCVFVFHPSGKVITKFGNRILEGYNFAGPHFCSVNSKGDIIITDFHNHCVRVFTSEGVAKFTFGSNGEGNGQFNAPTGIAIDANDNIIVADWGNSRIQVFDSQGSFLSFINTLADPLYGPQGLALTSDGNVVVADSGNHCFKVYKYLQ